MNKIYKVIWSKAKNCYVVVSEIAKRNGKCSSSINKKIIAAFLAAGLVTALPMSVDAAAYVNGSKVSDNGGATVSSTTNNATAWGNGKANNWRATAWGGGTASNSDSTAWGTGTAKANYATAFGVSTTASGAQSLAFGYSTTASAQNATAWGNYAKATQNQATAWGNYTNASGYRATAWGNYATASGSDATAFGTSTAASKNNSTAFGSYTKAAADQATAFGSNTYAGMVFTYNGEAVTPVRRVIERNEYDANGNPVKKEAWVLLDSNNNVVKTRERFDGGAYEGLNGESYALSYDGIINALTKTPGGYEQRNATAFGESSIASGADSTAFGYRTAATAWSATAWGHETSATGKRATAFGIETSASGPNSTAFGYRTEATNENTTVWGSNNKASGIGATAWGSHTESGGDNSTAWGKDSVVGGGSLTYGGKRYTNLSIQVKTEEIPDPGGSGQMVQIGHYYIEGRDEDGNVATIYDNGGNWKWDYNGSTDQSQRDIIKTWIKEQGGTLSGDYSTAFGESSKVYAENALGALGGIVKEGANNSAAIGKGATVTVEDSIALGSDSVANRDNVSGPKQYTGYNASTGNRGTANNDYKIGGQNAWVATNNAIAVGDGSTVTRQITGLAAGYEDTDAVNVAQLKSVTDAGLKFDANAGGVKTNKLGSTVRVVGEGAKAESAYSGKNVQTVITQDTKTGTTTIAVKIDENPEFESVTAGTNASTKVVISDKGVQVGGNTYINSTGINANSKIITNVAAGIADTDAVNVAQLNAAKSGVQAGSNTTVSKTENKDGSTTYTINAYDTQVKAGAGVTVTGGDLDKETNVRTYTVGVDNNDKLSVSDGVVSGGVVNKYWDSKQTEEAINSAYWTASDGTNDIHVSAGRTVRFEGKSGITVANVDGVFTFDANPLTFGGDTGTDVTRKLGEKVNVVGGATSNLTDNNIGVVADGTDKLTVKLAKDVDLTKDGSLAIGSSVINNAGVTATMVTAGTGASQTVIGSNGVQVGGKTYINNAGLNANDNKITNVAAGTAGTDAVNVNQLNDVKWNIGTGAKSGGTNNESGALDFTQVGKYKDDEGKDVDRSNIRFNAGAGVDISYSTILTGTDKDAKEIGYNIDISTKFQSADISSNGSGHYIKAITYDGRDYLLAGGGSGTAAPTDVISDNRAVTAELIKTYDKTTDTYDYAIEVLSPFVNVDGLKDENGKPAKIHADDFAEAKGADAIAIGKRAEAEAANSLAIGHNADAKAENSTAMGLNSHAHGANSVAIGVAATSSGNRAIAIGTTASHDTSREVPENASKPHQGSRAAGQASIVLGDHARALSENYQISDDLIGTPDYATNDAIAIGTKAEVRATNAIALGGNLSYTDEKGNTYYGELDGRQAGALVGDYADSGIAIGGAYGKVENGEIKKEISAAATYGVRGIAIGTGALVANQDDFAALEEVLKSDSYKKAKGDFQKARAEYLDKYTAYETIKDLPLNDPTLPAGMQISQDDKDRAQYEMNQAKATMEKATQVYSLELKKAVRLQEKDAVAESDAIAIGTKAVAQVTDSIALGSNSVTTATDKAGSRTGLSGYDPLQNDTDNDYFRGDDKYKEDDPVWRSTAGSLSVGGGTTTVKDEAGNDKTVTVTRRISNVAAGINDSDAVNVAQLKRATSIKSDSRNTSMGLDKEGNMVVNSPYLNIQGVKNASDYTTIVNRFDNADEYKQSLEDQKKEINSRKESIGVSQGIIKESLEKLEADYKAQKVKEAVYLAQKEDYEEQWDATVRRLADLDEKLKETDTQIANAEQHYQDAKEYYDSQANASGTDSIAVGNKAAAGGKESISIGSNNTVGTPGELDAGPDAEKEKNAQQSIAIGSGNTVTGEQSIAVGTGHKIYGSHSGAFGDPTEIDDSVDGSYAIGNNSHISTSDTFVLGNDVKTTYENSVFLGSNSAYVEDGKTTAGMSDYSEATINGKTYNYAGGKPAGVVSVGAEGEERRIQNVAAGKVSADSTDAINGSQLYGALENVNNSVNNLGDQISNVDSRATKGIAGAAALAALHPMEFDPDDKLTFAAGMGHYRGETAAALGMFYRPDEKVMFSIGGTLGNGENMVNAGVSFSLDRTPRVTGSRTALTKEVVQLREHVARQDAQIAELTALVRQLAGNAGMSMPAGSSLPTASPALFPDNLDNKWAYDVIEELEQQGYFSGYAGRTLTRQQFAAALDCAMTGGAQLSERLIKEFEPELSHVRVAHVNGKGDEEGKSYERPRFGHDKLEKNHEIAQKYAHIKAKQK